MIGRPSGPCLVALLTTVAAVGTLVAGCVRRPTGGPPAGKAPPGKAQRAAAETKRHYGRIAIDGTTLTGADAAGEPLWRATAARVDFDETSQRATLGDVECAFFDHGALCSRYRAGELTVDYGPARRQLRFARQVRAESLTTGAAAAFGQATYLWDERRLVDARPVELTKGDMRIRGTLLEGDVDLRKARVTGEPARLTAR